MATRKPAVPQDEKFENTDLDIFKVLEALDNKDYGFYDRLTEEQQKKFVPYVILHWMSSIKANGMLGAYYVMSTDANANKYMFNERVQQHPKLQWLMLCAASPGMGKQFHQWIPHLSDKIGQLKTEATKKEVKDYFTKVFAGASSDDIDEAASQFVKDQRHKVKLSKMFPEMKISDIEVLAQQVTQQDIEDYERECGN
jgi:hypothetical protein